MTYMQPQLNFCVYIHNTCAKRRHIVARTSLAPMRARSSMAKLEDLLRVRRAALVAAENASEAVAYHFNLVAAEVLKSDIITIEVISRRLDLIKKLQEAHTLVYDNVKFTRERADMQEDSKTRQLDYDVVKNMISARDGRI
jgi:hypothetical protein